MKEVFQETLDTLRHVLYQLEDRNMSEQLALQMCRLQEEMKDQVSMGVLLMKILENKKHSPEVRH